MSKIKIALTVIIALIVWFLVAEFIAADRYQALVNVKEEEGIMGVNPTAESLDFGDLSRGMKAARYLVLKNNGKNNISIKIVVLGEIKDLIKVEKNNFILKPGEEVKINFELTVPPSAEARKYQGVVYIFKSFTI